MAELHFDEAKAVRVRFGFLERVNEFFFGAHEKTTSGPENIRKTVDIRYVMKSGRLRDAQTLDEIWPVARPYGKHPWKLDEMDRLDTRPDDYFNHPPRPVP